MTAIDERLDDWRDQALCSQVDAEVFFPGSGESNRPAKRICGMCEVRAECLQHALDKGERFGVWGALSERERHKLERARVQRQRTPCGSGAAYAAHYRRGEKPCRACCDAYNREKRQRLSR